jgi:transcriptional regulator with XRE-family HTH domain
MSEEQEQQDVARRLREAIAHRGISQRDLARNIRVGEPTISAVIQGKQSPKAETLMAICKELRVHPSYVMLGLEPKYLDSGAMWQPVGAPAQRLSGVDAWLSTQDVPEEAAAWLRSLPWAEPMRQYQSSVYKLLLIAFEQMHPHSPDRSSPSDGRGHLRAQK